MPDANLIFNNRYLTLEEIGRGGFGCTYLALDTHMPSKPKCVVKRLAFETDDADLYDLVQTRFQREAAILEILGKLSSQIPSLYACSQDGANLYLVQEWIDGESLQDKLDKRPSLDEAEVIEILVHLLPVLDLIHSKNVIHRDIKPGNIMVRNDDGRPVLIDFGAVKEVIPITASMISDSSRSIFIGTPQFAPLEQHQGKPVFATDLYSLGLTAICLLTGKPPAWKDTDLSTGKPVIHRFRPGNWHSYAPRVGSVLKEALDKAIQPTIGNRFQSAREMQTALHLRRSIRAFAPRTQPSGIDRLAELASRYNQIRKEFDQLGRERRRELMRGVLNEMVKLSVEYEALNMSEYLNSDDWGMRLAAFAYVYTYPRIDILAELIRSVKEAGAQPFVQYRGLEAIGKILQKYPKNDAGIIESVGKLKLLQDQLDAETQRYAELRRILDRNEK